MAMGAQGTIIARVDILRMNVSRFIELLKQHDGDLPVRFVVDGKEEPVLQGLYEDKNEFCIKVG